MIAATVNSAELDAVTRRLLARMGNLRPAMAGIGMEMENRIRNRADAKTDPSGAAWIGWADSTIRDYPADGNRRLLDRYGDMLGSLNYKATATDVEVGFGQPYAVYHEYGTARMPRRGLIAGNPEEGALVDDDEQAILGILYDLLDSTIDGR